MAPSGSPWAARQARTSSSKVPSPRFKHLPANERLTTQLARALSLDTVDLQLLNIEGVELTLTRRYDRQCVAPEDRPPEGQTNHGQQGPRGQQGPQEDRPPEGQVIRLHQEDLCQALGLWPGTKYEQEGGPSVSDLVTLLRERSTTPLPDVAQGIRWLMFNLLAGNSDAHGKNVSFVYSRPPGPGANAGIRLAPFYDLVCTRIYPSIDRHLAMGIGATHDATRDPGLVGRHHWEALALRLDVNPAWLLRQVRHQAQAAPWAFDRVAQEHLQAHGDSPAIEQIRRIVRQQCRRTLQLLD